MDTVAILLAVAGFLAGHYVLKLILEPAVAARKSIATIRTTYDYYRNIWANPPAPQTPASPDQVEASLPFGEPPASCGQSPYRSCFTTG